MWLWYSNLTPTFLGVPHRLVEEDNYRGYVVPGGTTVLANAWWDFRTSPHKGTMNLNVLTLEIQGDDTE